MARSSYNVKRNETLWPRGEATREAFIAKVWEEGAELYRELPWRNIDDPYAVLVSEVMLQQTQVSRVERYWERFLDAFPSLRELAEGQTAKLLELWQGLGYNRRALALKRSAEQAIEKYGGALPDSFDELIALPGIGPATASGVLAFAFEKPAVYLETNVRSVFIYELFSNEEQVADIDLLPYVADTAVTSDPRGWYYALLDYGADLKKRGNNPNRASTSYQRQSTFEGSRRQKRAEIVRIVLNASTALSRHDVRAALDVFENVHGRQPVEHELFDALIEELIGEGFLNAEDEKLSPPR